MSPSGDGTWRVARGRAFRGWNGDGHREPASRPSGSSSVALSSASLLWFLFLTWYQLLGPGKGSGQMLHNSQCMYSLVGRPTANVGLSQLPMGPTWSPGPPISPFVHQTQEKLLWPSKVPGLLSLGTARSDVNMISLLQVSVPNISQPSSIM